MGNKKRILTEHVSDVAEMNSILRLIEGIERARFENPTLFPVPLTTRLDDSPVVTQTNQS